MGEKRNEYFLYGKPVGQTPVAWGEDLDADGRLMLKQILKEIGCEGVDWIPLAQDRIQ
jgi:hypothetical protein